MSRTKWKRQTAVGIELLAEAGNVAALQQMYRGMGYSWSLPPSPLSTLDLYYRQAAAAHSLQRPFPYKLLPGCGGPPLPPSPHHPGLFSPAAAGLLSASSLPPLSLPAASAALQELSAAERSRTPCHSPGSPCPPGGGRSPSPSYTQRPLSSPSSVSPPPLSRRPYPHNVSPNSR
jgi:BarH-like protein